MQALEDGTNEAVCFKTDYWKEFYPPPDCRNTGCRDDSTSGCCCGADSNVPGAKEPTSKECQDETKYDLLFLSNLCYRPRITV